MENPSDHIRLLQEQIFTWSQLASIISTVAWSVSFYGQVWQNWKYKSVEGFSLDYLFLNMIGYTFYGIYSTVGFFYKDVQGAGTVLLGDLIFVYHAIPIVIVEAIQCCYYPRGKNKLSNWVKILGGILIFVVIIEFFFTQVVHVIQWTQYWNPVSALGYGKLIISFVKYSPAVYWNYKRKSTKGWSIFNILLDLVGGSFSLASGSVSMQNGVNITKLILAILTVFYDLIFVFQHYVLYRNNNNISIANANELESNLILNQRNNEVDVNDLVQINSESPNSLQSLQRQRQHNQRTQRQYYQQYQPMNPKPNSNTKMQQQKQKQQQFDQQQEQSSQDRMKQQSQSQLQQDQK